MKKTSSFLLFISILSLLGSLFQIILVFTGNSARIVDLLLTVRQSLPGVLMDQATYNSQLLMNTMYINIFSISSALICAAGVILMLLSKKFGYFIYIFGSIKYPLIIFLLFRDTFFATGVLFTQFIVPLIFIVLFAFAYRQLKQQQSKPPLVNQPG